MTTETDLLIEELATYELDPLGFVMWAFPWGERGTILENEVLEDWQLEYLDTLGKDLRSRIENYDPFDLDRQHIPPIRKARSTGHGSGKAALAAMLTWWAISTMPDAKGVVTANTENQLKTKTWPEIAKWHQLFIAKELFQVTATAVFPIDEEHQRTWRVDMVPWSKHNPQAFAGLHNMRRRVFLLFDEASTIDDVIFETAEGALTDAHTQIIVTDVWEPDRSLMDGSVSARRMGSLVGAGTSSLSISARFVVPVRLRSQKWLEDWGEDDDFFRVRVRAVFPRASISSFISYDTARRS